MIRIGRDSNGNAICKYKIGQLIFPIDNFGNGVKRNKDFWKVRYIQQNSQKKRLGYIYEIINGLIVVEIVDMF